jgi:hypothetical protein
MAAPQRAVDWVASGQIRLGRSNCWWHSDNVEFQRREAARLGSARLRRHCTSFLPLAVGSPAGGRKICISWSWICIFTYWRQKFW